MSWFKKKEKGVEYAAATINDTLKLEKMLREERVASEKMLLKVTRAKTCLNCQKKKVNLKGYNHCGEEPEFEAMSSTGLYFTTSLGQWHIYSHMGLCGKWKKERRDK